MRLFLTVFVVASCLHCSTETHKGVQSTPVASKSDSTTSPITSSLTHHLAYNSDNYRIFTEKFEVAKRAGESFSERVTAVASDFIGTPYKSGTLEKEGEEQLIINLSEVDCWTFVEYCVAIALTSLQTDTADYRLFANEVQRLRYREGVVDGYASRIHYFEEWILQQTSTGVFEDITQGLGGQPYKKRIAFMSNHPQLYPSLKSSLVLEKIKLVETNINQHYFHFIPKDKISTLTSKLHSGDLIAITSRLSDLDCEHEGFVVLVNEKAHLLHASYDYKKVVLSENSIAEYAKNKQKQTGFMILRK